MAGVQQLKRCVPSALTLGNIAFGFLAIAAAADGEFRRSCVLLFFAALCDLFDGASARLLDASTRFGAELDSLSDMVSFGIAPAALVYFAVLKPLGPYAIIAPVAYALAAAVRLARFNVDDGPLAKITFSGVPTPIAGGYMLSVVLVREHLSPWSVMATVACMAVMMVSTIKVPKFRRGNLPQVLLYVCIVAFIALLARPSAITWHLWNGWNLALVGINYGFLARRGHIGKGRGKRSDAELRLAA